MKNLDISENLLKSQVFKNLFGNFGKSFEISENCSFLFVMPRKSHEFSEFSIHFLEMFRKSFEIGVCLAVIVVVVAVFVVVVVVIVVSIGVAVVVGVASTFLWS